MLVPVDLLVHVVMMVKLRSACDRDDGNCGCAMTEANGVTSAPHAQSNGRVFRWAVAYDLLLNIIWRDLSAPITRRRLNLPKYGLAKRCWILAAERGHSLLLPSVGSSRHLGVQTRPSLECTSIPSA
jgi:hypothetical protein